MNYVHPDSPNYEEAHELATNEGLAIPIGGRCKMSGWGIEHLRPRKIRGGVVKGKARRGRTIIRVKLDGLKTTYTYWAGFWEKE